MSRSLLRPCRGCGKAVRGKPRCVDCQRHLDQVKRQRRPDLHNNAKERDRRRRVVADHRAIVGDWCPGWERQPAHQSADLVVRCRSCNAARSAHLARAAEPPITHRDDDPGPVAV